CQTAVAGGRAANRQGRSCRCRGVVARDASSGGGPLPQPAAGEGAQGRYRWGPSLGVPPAVSLRGSRFGNRFVLLPEQRFVPTLVRKGEPGTARFGFSGTTEKNLEHQRNLSATARHDR